MAFGRGRLAASYRRGMSLLPGPWLGRRLSTWFAVCESLVCRISSATYGFHGAALLCSMKLGTASTTGRVLSEVRNPKALLILAVTITPSWFFVEASAKPLTFAYRPLPPREPLCEIYPPFRCSQCPLRQIPDNSTLLA